MQGADSNNVNARDRRIHDLALAIAGLMREHPDRAEANDAYDMASIIFRKPKSNLRPAPQSLAGCPEARP
jgi:hypothetical protein